MNPIKLDLDSQVLPFPCTGCGKEIKEKIGRLKKNPSLVCPVCRSTIHVKADELLKAIQTIEKELDKLRVTLSKGFKLSH